MWQWQWQLYEHEQAWPLIRLLTHLLVQTSAYFLLDMSSQNGSKDSMGGRKTVE